MSKIDETKDRISRLVSYDHDGDDQIYVKKWYGHQMKLDEMKVSLEYAQIW